MGGVGEAEGPLSRGEHGRRTAVVDTLDEVTRRADAVRRIVIGMTVTAEERKRIKAAAEADDLSISARLRRLVLGGLKGR